jgi:endonuclease/exonuclease/phosphatase family metal-dependent hydrolase
MIFRRILKIFLALAFTVNLIFILAAAGAPYIDPYYFWWPALIGLFFKIFFILNILFIVIFLRLKYYRLAIFAALMILPCIPILSKTFAVHPGRHSQATGTIKLLTYNVRSFGHYDGVNAMPRIVENIKSENPDIVSLQEYLMNPQLESDAISRMKALGYVYYYQYCTVKVPPDNRGGLAIFSKIPFCNFHPIKFKNSSNGAYYVDVPLKNDTLRLINVHLQSIGLAKWEYTIPTTKAEFEERRIHYWITALKKFRHGFRKRAYEARKIREVLDKTPYKAIVCGDCNDYPDSYVYHIFTEKLDDSFLSTSMGIGTTFAGKIPWQRIDYVFTSPGINVTKTYVRHIKGSDHYPVICEFSCGR